MVNCTIKIEPGESVESMWRRFRKATDRAGVYKDYARSQEFIPKSKRRAAKSSKARARKAKYENA
jgi:ribosomal protein S21